MWYPPEQAHVFNLKPGSTSAGHPGIRITILRLSYNEGDFLDFIASLYPFLNNPVFDIIPKRVSKLLFDLPARFGAVL
jgi:hypothetical protein